MTITNNYPIIKPSDAVSWEQCARRVWLDNKGKLDHAKTEDAFEQLMKTIKDAIEISTAPISTWYSFT